MPNTAEDNVISFDKYDPANRKSGNEATARALEDVRELCRQRLAGNVRYMMGKCDDALYGCAQMAESRMVHDLYLDAIDELKAISNDIEGVFIDRFVEQFNLGVPRHIQQWSTFEPGTEQDYADTAFHREEQASEDLVICTMIDKTRSECSEVLGSLDRRIGFLIRDPDLELWQNPLGPEPICEAFRKAVNATVGRLNHGYEIRPILFKLFNEHVMGDMHAIYKELNHRLIKLGVQPQLQAKPAATDNSAGSPGQQDALPEPGNHPARPPLDRLADSASGRDERPGQDDPLYKKVSTLLQTVLNGCDDDARRFDTLLEDLEAFLGARKTQAAVSDPQSTGLQEGRGRLEVAKSSAVKQVEAHIGSGCVIEFINDFVTTHWKDLLLLIHARDGKQSDQWKQAISTLDDLVWSVKPGKTPAEHQRLMALQPALLHNLREGMHRLSIPATEQDAFLARLRHAHASTFARDFTAQVRQLRKGAWLEMLDRDGKRKRIKLSWMSPITKTYLFTDEKGVGAGNYSVDELAELFRSGRARKL